MKKFLVLLVSLGFIFLSGCTTLGDGKLTVPNFQDGTWSSCTYTKDGKLKGPYPFQIPPGMPIPNIVEGIDVKCTPIPMPAPTPSPVPAPN